MIPKTILDVVVILAASFAIVLVAVRLLPKQSESNIVQLKPRVQHTHKKVRKAS